MREWAQAQWVWPREGVRKEKVALAAGGRVGGSVSTPGAWGPVFPQDPMERPRVSDSGGSLSVTLPAVLVEGHVQEIGRRLFFRAARNVDRRGRCSEQETVHQER